MTQPSSPPAPAGPLVNTLNTLAPCTPAPAWIATFTTPQDAWNGCPYGDWLLWFCFRQAPNLAERQRLAGCLGTMLATYVTSANIPDAPSLASAQALITSIQGFAGNTVTALQLRLAASATKVYQWPKRTLLTIETPAIPPTSVEMLEHEIGTAVVRLAQSCAANDPTTSANIAVNLGAALNFMLISLAQAVDPTTANVALAPMIRAAVTFQNFVPAVS